jgi:hypothetical protein
MIDTGVDVRPFKDPEIIRTLYQQKTTQALHPKLTSKEVKELIASMTKVMMLAVTLNSYCIGRDYWRLCRRCRFGDRVLVGSSSRSKWSRSWYRFRGR